MQRLSRSIRAALGALLLAGQVHAAAEIQYRATNLNLEEAKKRLVKGTPEEALEELKIAEGLPGNTNRHRAEIFALRASALLAQPASPERKQGADEALVALFHTDPEGAALAAATAAAQERAKALKAERPLLLHERQVTVRSGRPVLLRARLSGAQPGSARLFAHYRVEPDAADQSGSDEDYVQIPLEPTRSGAFEGYLRPGIGGIPAGGEHVVRYFLEARSPEGTLLDANGSAREPIRAQLSATRAEGVPDTALALDEGGRAQNPVLPPPPTPWYRRWAVVGPIGGAVVVGAVVAVILLQPKPQPVVGTLGRIDLP